MVETMGITVTLDEGMVCVLWPLVSRQHSTRGREKQEGVSHFTTNPCPWA